MAIRRGQRSTAQIGSDREFDYIIVGAGAAGCVLANRLTADGSASVLLIEAGGQDRSPVIRIPAGFSKVMGTKYNWKFFTAPQRHLNNRRIYFPQGRVLGGSTAINAMLYVRGNRLDYDEWAKLGNDGWTYDDVLPYFKRSEHNERLADAYHGTDGPMNVADQAQPTELAKAFVRAGQQAGNPYNADPNGASQEGVFFHQVTQRCGLRVSAATAFLHPVRRRPNLTVLSDSSVARLTVDGNRATGVELVQNGQQEFVRARREVVVSAGAVNSPKLLLQSGIGPADELESVGVRPIHDLRGVGKNLQDQMQAWIAAECKEPISYTGEDRGPKAAAHLVRWATTRTGPATATVTEGGGFISSNDSVRSPDIQLHFLPVYVIWKDGKMIPEQVKGHGVTMLATNVRPQSRGEVKLASSDPSALPIVDPNYLAEPEDVATSLRGFRIMREIFSQPELTKHLKGEWLPGANVRADDEVIAYMRQWGKTDYHPVGTCKMGVDEMAVVDPQLRVHGMEGLRVIDSSIMPTITSGNTQGPSIMIGERGADFLLNS